MNTKNDDDPDATVVRLWWRTHMNGWRGSVDEYASGIFRGGGQEPKGFGVTGGWRGEYRTLAAAQAAADRDVAATGHACGDQCGPWGELVPAGNR